VIDHSDAATGHRARGPAAVARARPVVLLRYRPGIGGRTARVVHLVPQPLAHQPGTAGVAFCGALLRPELVETVSPGQGARCILCTINHGAVAPAGRISRKTNAGTAAGRYRAWGWPVTSRGHQVWLDLEPTTVALTIPAPLVTEATKLLHQWRCPPPALMIHPDAPEHRVMLATERHSRALLYPRGVHRSTGALPLPPTTTPHGTLIWALPPQAGPLQLCREFDVFAALRTVLRDPLA